MAPKAKGPSEKEKQQAAQKKIEDKTFGLKNKNKSKAVQQQIQQLKRTVGGGDDPKKNKEKEEAAAAAAMNAVLFQEALSKKDIERKRLEKMAAAAAAAAKSEKPKEPEKKDIYSDSRDAELADDMSTWDDEKLKQVVNQKAGGQGERCKTDIICKHFLDAVEKRQYGWFWECPNGGDKCQYRHALPEEYVLKRDKVLNMGGVDEGPKLEDEIEERRKALTTRTPVTLERLTEWLRLKKEKAAAVEAEEFEAIRAKYSKTGKASGVTGKMLFSLDSSLFVDDAAANDVHYEREESDDDGDGDAPSAAGASSSGGGSATKGPPAALPTAPPAAPSGGACGNSTGDSGTVAYSANYTTDGSAAGAAAAAGGEAAAGAELGVADLEGVDESLFLDEDLPDDDDLE